MTLTASETRHATGVRSVAPAVAAAGLAMLLSRVVPLAGPLLVALVLGAVAANTRLGAHPVLRGQAGTTKFLLRLGVVMLGLELPVQRILEIGPGGLVVAAATVGVTFFATIAIGDRLGLDRGLVTLIAAGFSICGAAAIAAVDDAVRAKERHVALAIAMVTVFGSAMIVLIPWLGAVVDLTPEQTAIWAGASIHEVAQVVAAASLLGPAAVAIATTVKLGRVLMLAPMYAVASRRSEHPAGTGTPLVPWFVVAFAVAVAVRSTGLLPETALSAAALVTTLLLAAGMFGLGLGIRAKDVWPIRVPTLVLACASTCVAAGTSLVLTVWLT